MTRKSQPRHGLEEDVSRQREEAVQGPEVGLGLVCLREVKEAGKWGAYRYEMWLERSPPFVGPLAKGQVAVLTEHGTWITVMCSGVTVAKSVRVTGLGSLGTRQGGGRLQAVGVHIEEEGGK